MTGAKITAGLFTQTERASRRNKKDNFLFQFPQTLAIVHDNPQAVHLFSVLKTFQQKTLRTRKVSKRKVFWQNQTVWFKPLISCVLNKRAQSSMNHRVQKTFFESLKTAKIIEIIEIIKFMKKYEMVIIRLATMVELIS